MVLLLPFSTILSCKADSRRLTESETNRAAADRREAPLLIPRQVLYEGERKREDPAHIVTKKEYNTHKKRTAETWHKITWMTLDTRDPCAFLPLLEND